MLNPCPVCNEGHCSPYDGVTWPTPFGMFTLLRCDTCHSAFTHPRPTDADLDRLYATAFDFRWYRDHYLPKLRDCSTRIREYGRSIGQRILDYGGGVGYFSRAAREFGLASITYDRYVAGAVPARASWDSVVALHVLEHSNDLDRTIEEIRRFLVPGGKAILAVPNFESTGYQELRMGWVWAQPPLVHIFHFTAAGLTALLKRHGFHQITASFHERWDANICSDVRHVRRQRILDSLWGIQPLNRFAVYRRAVARLNAAVRFHDLEKATRFHMESDSRYSELQIIATLGVA